MKFTEESIKIAEYTLNNVDIYLIDNFPYKLLAHDVGASHKNLIEEIRTRWLYSSSGFFSTINSHNNFFKRVSEFLVNLDYPKSLRQRINIVHEMLECNFNSLVPIHASISLKEDSQQILDADNILTGNNFSWIIHPGQTRAQASVFCKHNVNKVLLYISKKHSNKITFKNFDKIQKIDTLDKLYQVYKPLGDYKNIEYKVDFDFGRDDVDIVNRQKIHRHNNNVHIPILKAIRIYINDIFDKNNTINRHPSTEYATKSFFSFDKFCSIFHNSQFNIYTTKRPSFLIPVFSRINEKLLTPEISKVKFSTKKFLEILDVDEKTDTPIGSPLLGLLKYYKEENYKAFLRAYDSFFNQHIEEFRNKKINHSFTLINLPVLPVEKNTTFKDIVKKNNYKGFTLFLGDLEYDKFNRSPIEFLFFISAFNTITVSEDREVAIINCEHEYWKTGENYKEWKLTKEMYSE